MFEPPHPFSTRNAVALGNVADSGSSDPKKSYHAQQQKRVLGYSNGETMALLGFVDEVL